MNRCLWVPHMYTFTLLQFSLEIVLFGSLELPENSSWLTLLLFLNSLFVVRVVNGCRNREIHIEYSGS